MTLTITSPKRVYAAEPTAMGIRTKLEKANPERKFDIVKIAAGWQVVEITKLPAYMPPAKPLPVMKPADILKPKTTENTVALTFQLHSDSPKFIGIVTSEGPKYIGKGTIMGYESMAGNVTIEMDKKMADKKGFHAHALTPLEIDNAISNAIADEANAA